MTLPMARVAIGAAVFGLLLARLALPFTYNLIGIPELAFIIGSSAGLAYSWVVNPITGSAPRFFRSLVAVIAITFIATSLALIVHVAWLQKGVAGMTSYILRLALVGTVVGTGVFFGIGYLALTNRRH